MLLACSLDPGRNTIPRKIGVLVGIHINSWITLHSVKQVYNCFILPLTKILIQRYLRAVKLITIKHIVDDLIMLLWLFYPVVLCSCTCIKYFTDVNILVGFNQVINHNVPEKLMEMTMDSCQRFFNITEEEKREFAGKHVLDPIRCGTSFNASVEKVFFWRDFLKVFVHPEFHSPNKPVGFRY